MRAWATGGWSGRFLIVNSIAVVPRIDPLTGTPESQN